MLISKIIHCSIRHKKSSKGSIIVTNKILVAEDDPDIQEILKLYLENAGFTVIRAENGLEAYEKAEQEQPDLALVDIMMPGLNGYELTKRIRKTSRMPILILSAMNADSDKILGLEIGADDYITKPFNPLEVVARIKSNLRRSYELDRENETAKEEMIRVGALELDPYRFILKKDGQDLPLTPTELKIMRMLMEHPGRVFTKKQIFEQVLGEFYYNSSDDNSIMVHISNIREKIGDSPKDPAYLKTVRGLGYKIEATTK